MAKVVILGNGPVKNLGSKIDSFDVVCRIKSYSMESLGRYIKDRGKKTTILYDFKCSIRNFKRGNRFPGVELIPFNIALKNDISKKVNSKVTNGIPCIIQTLKKYGPPIYICGFQFQSNIPRNHYCPHPEDHRRTSYDDREKSHYFNRPEFKAFRERLGVDNFEDPTLEGGYIQKFIDKGEIKWLT